MTTQEAGEIVAKFDGWKEIPLEDNSLRKLKIRGGVVKSYIWIVEDYLYLN